MGTATELSQLLRSLCHGTQWKYAVYWKQKHGSSMLLAWEDGYCDSPKPGVTVEKMLENGFFNGEPGIIYFARDMVEKSGTSAGCAIGLAVANMSCHFYSLGEGIIGKVAYTGKHRWIFVSNFNSKVLPEYPDDWQFQFAAGIKTILLVPVVPLGVVQLGSLEMVAEDSTVITHIKDLFNSLQHAEACAPTSNRDPFNPSSSLSTPLIRNFSPSSAVTGNLQTHAQSQDSQLFMKKDLMAPGIKQITKNKQSNVTFNLSPLFMVPDDLSLSQDDTQHVLGIDMGLYMDGSTWKAIYSAISEVPTKKLCILNQSLCSGHSVMMEGDMSGVAPEDELNAPSQCNAKQSAMLDSCKEDLQHGGHDYCLVRGTMGQPFGKETYKETSHDVIGSLLNFPNDSELHKALGPAFLQGHDDCAWEIWSSGEDGLSSPTVACHREETKAYKSLVAESSSLFMKESDTEHLLDAVVANLYASDESASNPSIGVRSPSIPSGKFVGSCLTQSEYEGDIMGADDSSPRSHVKSALLSGSDVFASSTPRSSFKSVSPLIDEEQQNKGPGYEQYKRSTKLSYVGKRKTKTADIHRPRPRDRQLIQDRVKELRELVPNGAKCSIDTLLDLTIKHMLFLQNVSGHAEKLRRCAHPKVTGENLKSAGTPVHQNGASWACELGSQTDVCPILVENLDKPGQMLVEMQCKEYGFFLEIVQVIKHLELTILKGVMETRSDELWANFIVEAPRGFHRMDILWPLMQLLQRHSSPIPSKF